MATSSADDQLTPQQRQAVHLRGVSIVLSSGAGCGKTHVLTERYLAHLRADRASVSQVVAITFTDRAARQMRERIRRALVQELRQADAADAERWADHLRGLETAPISTIHAFCGNLLRQHAVELGLDPGFVVLEDVLSANFEVEALTACLQELLTARTEPGEDLRQLVLLYGWRPTVEAIQHLMRARDEAAWQEWLARPAEQIAAEWAGTYRARLLERYIEYLLAANAKITDCLERLRSLRDLGPEAQQRVERVLTETPQLATAPDLAAAVESITAAAGVGHSRKIWPADERYEAIKEAFDRFRKELPNCLRVFLQPPEKLTEAVVAGQRALRVAAEAVQWYQKRKRRAAVVDFQDLLILARDLLRDHAEVRERLQRRFRFLLIDELQDTDPVQMELVEHLCGADLTTGKLFAVGDHKQSIYRFRAADVQLFQELGRRVPEQGRLPLNLNFRSQPAILHFVNALFARRMEGYQALEAHVPQLNPGPCVEFLWSPREEEENVTEARKREADWIARRITAMIETEEQLVVDHSTKRLRSVRPGDIVLLFRAMTSVALYESALRNHGLDYYLVGGRAFFAQQEIYDLFNLLRALENPQDAVSLAGTLRSPFGCLSDETLLLLGLHPDGLWEGLHDPATVAKLPEAEREAAERARRFLDRWRGLKDRLPIARLLSAVFADCGYDAAVQFEWLGDRKLANLWKLQELARTFDRSGLFGLAEFVQRLGDLVRTQPREEQAATQPEKADVVRLMTIHQAKGLEFPVVVVPDLAAERRGSARPVALWDRRLGCVVRPPRDESPPPFSGFGQELWEAAEEIENWHEDLRTLYVACTRAQDYLVLSACLPQPVRPAGTWMRTLAERFNLETGTCLDAAIPAERRPAVRVIRQLEALPSSRRFVAPISREPLVPAQPRGSEPIPVRSPGTEVIALTALARLWHRRADRGLFDDEGGSSHFSVECPAFDTEDGSDRTAWRLPQEAVAPLADRTERVLHRVLAGWDWRTPDGWRALLSAALEPESLAARQQLRIDLQQQLSRFLASAPFRKVSEAVVCHRNLEFLLRAAAVEGLTAAGETVPGPLIRGVIDCLWRDGKGAWHLLALATGQPSSRVDPWLGLKPTVFLWACAVQQQFDAWPKSATLYRFADGKVFRATGRNLRTSSIIETVREAMVLCQESAE
jgi:ATP-dependent helicase/nuclease subunit A